MNDFFKYREEAHLKYEKYKQKIEDDEKMVKEELEKKNLIDSQHSYIYDVLQEWDKIVENLYIEPISTLTLLSDIILYKYKDFLLFLEKYNRFEELQERVIKLVHSLNERQEQTKSSIKEINEIYIIMKEIIDITKVDISIEIMNTEKDEEISRQLDLEFKNDYSNYSNYSTLSTPKLNNDYNNYLTTYNKIVEDYRRKHKKYEKKEDLSKIDISSMDVDDIKNIEEIKIGGNIKNIPSVCISSNSCGLKLVDMKELAKSNGISTSGTKKDLAKKLEEKGLVRVIG